MTELDPALGDVVSAKVQMSGQMPYEPTPLSIAVLGPGLEADNDPGTTKRKQIVMRSPKMDTGPSFQRKSSRSTDRSKPFSRKSAGY